MFVAHCSSHSLESVSIGVKNICGNERRSKIEDNNDYSHGFWGKCDFLDELKSSLEKLQDTVDKISLEQNNTNQKVDQLQDTVLLFGLVMK